MCFCGDGRLFFSGSVKQTRRLVADGYKGIKIKLVTFQAPAPPPTHLPHTSPGVVRFCFPNRVCLGQGGVFPS